MTSQFYLVTVFNYRQRFLLRKMPLISNGELMATIPTSPAEEHGCASVPHQRRNMSVLPYCTYLTSGGTRVHSPTVSTSPAEEHGFASRLRQGGGAEHVSIIH